MATAELTAFPRADWKKVATFAAVFLAAVLAAASGLAAGEGSKSALVLPIAIGAGLILAVLALTRFQLYVMIMLFTRSTLDLAKLSQRTAGTTSVGASSRRSIPRASWPWGSCSPRACGWRRNTVSRGRSRAPRSAGRWCSSWRRAR
ncbi:MAG: hypothetical protein JO248_12245 [Acidimicrobiia bacterium]|nr:hypothetical protein [Acidimicrobiia bacterium]